MGLRRWLSIGLLGASVACGAGAFELYQTQAAPIPHAVPSLSVSSQTVAIPVAKQTSWPIPNGVVPEHIKIPAIGVNTNVQQVGMTNGQVGVPDNWVSTAWYDAGTRPGGIGSAVIDGHISSVHGPAVFYRLHQLQPGDDVIVLGDAGQKLTFRVVQVAAYPRNDAPLQRIFGDFNTRSLNLITCAGLWDSAADTHTERLVVYTQLVSETVHGHTSTGG